MWTVQSIAILIGAVAAAVGTVGAAAGSLLTILLTRGIEARLKLQKANSEQIMEEKKYEDSQEAVAFQQATAAYERLILAFESRVGALETALVQVNKELKESRQREADCLVKSEELRGDLKALQVHVDRLWQHDKANKEHAAGLAAAVKQVEAKVHDSGSIDLKPPEGTGHAAN